MELSMVSPEFPEYGVPRIPSEFPKKDERRYICFTWIVYLFLSSTCFQL
jgi:hypothetical protein